MKTALIAIAASNLFIAPAQADPVCMSAAELQSSLIDWYGERPVTDSPENNTRLWVSDATGSWTLVRTISEDEACVEATGDNWSTDINARQMLETISLRLEG